MKIGNGKIYNSMASKVTFKSYKYKIISTGAGTSTRENASVVRIPFDLLSAIGGLPLYRVYQVN